MRTYFFIYLCSTLLAFVLTPVVIYIARILKIYDNPDVRKVHASAIPRIGGVAVFLSTSTLAITVLFLDNSVGEAFRGMQAQVLTLLAAGTFIFLTGFVDDMCGIGARYKLLAQVAAAAAMCLAGVRIDSLNFAGLFTLHFSQLSFPITIFWIVAITNAVNLIDGLDGLAAGISAVACAVIAIFAFDTNQPLMAVLMLALLGSLSGFLFFNFNPARIFMGDCGSMFLGFVLASSSVMCAMKTRTIVALALPVLALGLPIFDMIFSILRRYLKRRGIMSPDRSHLHHILLDMGLRHRHVVIVMYALTLLAAGLGMFMMLTGDVGTIAIFFCVLLLLALVFRIVGAVRLRETIAWLKQKHTISHQMKQEIENFEKAELCFRQARTLTQWWQILSWERSGQDAGIPDLVKITVPVRDRRAGSLLNLEVQVCANGSLESAGRRIALFGRLIEEYGVANLPNETGTNIRNCGTTA
jgi:UDP-GlcNAc:undecaprenyl-phosphate GlcNAc-1-phosphate transferase